ncbi:unnamed protein product [Caenorhabditis brenneri]
MQLETSPDVHWVFYLEPKGFLDGFMLTEVTKDIFVSTWESQSPEDIERTPATYLFDTVEPKSVHCQYLYTENRLKRVRSWIKFLSQLFHLNIRVLHLCLQLDISNIYDVLKLLSLNIPMDQFAIQCDEQDNLIRTVLDHQKATERVSIRVKPSPSFEYDTTVFNLSGTFECNYSHWITFDQMCSMQAVNVTLMRSNFQNHHFTEMINRFKNGWLPKWFIGFFKCNQDLQLDEIVTEEHTELDRYLPDEPFDMNDPVKFYKFHFAYFIQEFSMLFEARGYHIIREDGRIATFYVCSDNNALFHVHPENSEKLTLAFHVGLLPD